MKNYLKLIGAFCCCAIFILACKKDKKTEQDTSTSLITPVFNNTNVKQLIINTSTPLQTFTVNSQDSSTFICNNGTVILICPNAFLTESGGAVTGNVTIEVKDILTKKDMILNNATPVSNGQLLVSGGEIYINATQNNQQLKINTISKLSLYLPVIDPPSNVMKEFYAKGPATLSNTNLNWATNNVLIPIFGVGTPSATYLFDIDSLGWTNCDYFYNLPGAKTTCTVNTTGISNNSNTKVFISMNGTYVLASINTTDNANVSQAFVTYANSIPVGSAYTIVAITFDGTNYFYGSQSITMVNNMVVNMPALTQTTLSQIKTNLTTLP